MNIRKYLFKEMLLKIIEVIHKNMLIQIFNKKVTFSRVLIIQCLIFVKIDDYITIDRGNKADKNKRNVLIDQVQYSFYPINTKYQ